MTFCCISLICVFLEISSEWHWEILVFFIVLSNLCSQLYSFRWQVSENPKSLCDSSCFQQQLPLVHSQMENENPICILCPIFSLMGRFRYFGYLNNIKTQARLALGQSSIFVLMGEFVFCNCFLTVLFPGNQQGHD